MYDEGCVPIYEYEDLKLENERLEKELAESRERLTIIRHTTVARLCEQRDKALAQAIHWRKEAANWKDQLNEELAKRHQ